MNHNLNSTGYSNASSNTFNRTNVVGSIGPILRTNTLNTHHVVNNNSRLSSNVGGPFGGGGQQLMNSY